MIVPTVLLTLGVLVFMFGLYVAGEMDEPAAGLGMIILAILLVIGGFLFAPVNPAPISYSQQVIETIRACGDNPDPVLCYMENGLEITKR